MAFWRWRGMAQVLLRRRRIDDAFLARYTNMPWLVMDKPDSEDNGLFARDASGKTLIWDMHTGGAVDALNADCAPALFGEYALLDGTKVKTAMTMFIARAMEKKYAPENAAKICGIGAQTIERIALEMAAAAFDNPPQVATKWQDCFGRTHDSFVGRAVAMHAMRGVSAHSNGFQTCLPCDSFFASAFGRDRFSRFAFGKTALSQTSACSAAAGNCNRTRQTFGGNAFGNADFTGGFGD